MTNKLFSFQKQYICQQNSIRLALFFKIKDKQPMKVPITIQLVQIIYQ